MSYLVAGTAVVWIGILGYMMSLSKRMNKIQKQVDKAKQYGSEHS
jgi:CcmD family protein